MKYYHQVTCCIIITFSHCVECDALPSTVWTQLRSEIPADRRHRAAAGTGYGAVYTCAAPAVPGLQNKIQTEKGREL